jgi:O-succinylbenzoic acid--CoA ligase
MKVHFLTTDLKTISETANFLALWEDENDSIDQLTSGSTGTPKKIKINKNLMRASARMTGAFFNLAKGQTALLCISPEFIGGKMMVVRSIEFELEIYATEISSTPLKNLNQPIDFAAMVPMQVSETLTHHPEKLNLIRNLIIGGAPVSKKLEIALQSINCTAYSTYGMTETISHIALKKLNNQNEPFKAIGETSFSIKNECLVIKAKLPFDNVLYLSLTVMKISCVVF